jgi:hypothetical protein
MQALGLGKLPSGIIRRPLQLALESASRHCFKVVPDVQCAVDNDTWDVCCSTTAAIFEHGALHVQVRQPSDSVLLFGGTKITATATDSLGNTSEFSACTTYDDNGIFGNGFDPPPM